MKINTSYHLVDKDNPFFSFLHFLEAMLQCNAPIVKEVMFTRRVSTTTLLMLQGYVMKSLEERW
jgi:hypothetical protein